MAVTATSKKKKPKAKKQTQSTDTQPAQITTATPIPSGAADKETKRNRILVGLIVLSWILLYLAIDIELIDLGFDLPFEFFSGPESIEAIESVEPPAQTDSDSPL